MHAPHASAHPSSSILTNSPPQPSHPTPTRAVTVASAALCLVLLVSELLNYTRVEVVNHMTVDSTSPSIFSDVPINFHITFPLVPCRGARACGVWIHRRAPIKGRSPPKLTPPTPTADISFDVESTRGEEVVHLEASDVRKVAARGDETPVDVPPNTQGCTVQGTLFTGKVAGEFRINLGEDQPLELAPVGAWVAWRGARDA